MKSSIQCKKGTPPIHIIIALACFGLLPRSHAVSPPPPGGYPNFTTAAGDHALQALTLGVGNIAIGTFSLFSVTTGNFNTAVGAGALDLNTADSNTATGAAALLFNTTGTENTANGTAALELNTTGFQNTANGAFALFNNSTGSNNTGVGFGALRSNTTGNDNTATGADALRNNVGAQNTANGSQALFSNTSGSENTADGYQALFASTTGTDNTGIGREALTSCTTGSENTAVGRDALGNSTTGSNNIAVGVGAGVDLITGDGNIYIGNSGSGESDTIRIGNSQTHAFIAGITGVPVTGTAVVANIFGQLGVAPSSQRFKEDVKPMDSTSEALLALKPVTFRYKHEIDPARTSQFGLVAEDVEKVNPDLVVHDKEGKPYSVRYDQVNAMLLNEFLKEHRAFAQEKCKVTEQQKEIDTLRAELREQRSLIQKVSDKLELTQSVIKIVTHDP